MGFHHQEGLRYFQFDLFCGQSLFHAVLTRKGGVSQAPYNSLNTGGTVGDDPDAVLENHRRIYQILDYPFDSRFDVWQVHGARVLSAEAPRPLGTPHPKADGIITDKPGITLFMRFADCVPILLYDPVRCVIGIIHAGWQGTCLKVAEAAIRMMSESYGSEPGDILAGIGPSICRDCYEVGEEVQHAFRSGLGSSAEDCFHRKGQSLYLDLWLANEMILRRAGVDQIQTAGLCTACNLDDWYSHRAENGRTGRFGVLMALEE